jgi:glycosyltransferase involved in cell wall biosynthesis
MSRLLNGYAYNTNMIPIVSIILPTYNGARTIARAIESVIEQSYTAWELLVVEDGSTDGVADIVHAFSARDSRIRYIKNETNLGIQKSLNKGIAEAKGKYIARIDDDDFWTDREKLSLQCELVQNDPSIVLVGTGVTVVDEKGTELFRYLFPETDTAIRRSILYKNCFAHSTVLFSKEVALAAGGYGETKDVRHVEDYDLWLRMGTLGTFFNIPRYAIGFTVHAGSISSKNKSDQLRKNLALIKKHRKEYSGYGRALVVGWLRLGLYQLVWLVPDALLKPFIGWYKNNW